MAFIAAGGSRNLAMTTTRGPCAALFPTAPMLGGRHDYSQPVDHTGRYGALLGGRPAFLVRHCSVRKGGRG